MNKIITSQILCVLSCILVVSLSSLQVEAASYPSGTKAKSHAGITFTEDSDGGNNSGGGNTGGGSTSPDSPNEPNKPTTPTKPEGEFPQTGEKEWGMWLVQVGLFISLFSVILIRFKRKNAWEVTNEKI